VLVTVTTVPATCRGTLVRGQRRVPVTIGGHVLSGLVGRAAGNMGRDFRGR
jgi:hypothetical protein